MLPILSLTIEALVRRRRGAEVDILSIALRWFTFWIVGVRLFTAGLSQAIQPQYTAGEIFGIEDPIVLPFITELGFANLALGTIGLASLFVRSWVTPAAVAGAVFLGLAGVRHVIEGGDFTPERTLATVTDLLALLVLGGGALALALRKRGLSERSTPPTA